MTDNPFQIDRRAVLWGMSAAGFLPATALMAQTRTVLSLEAVAGTIDLKPGQTSTPIWQLTGGPAAGALRFKRGDNVDVTLTNRLPVPVALNWVGLDGAPALEPLTGQPAIAPNTSATFAVTFRHAGTMLAELWVIGPAQVRTITSRAVIVSEAETVAADRDEVLLIADWRVKPDGSVVAPQEDAGDAALLFTVNGGTSWDIKASLNERIRFRIINSSQDIVSAIKISDYLVWITAIDGQPSEPFLARDGLLVLAPKTRIDAFVDVTRPAGSSATLTLLDGREARPIGQIVTSDAPASRPAALPPVAALPSNGLPTQIDLKSAMRVELALNTAGATEWLALSALTPTTPPAFKIKRGRPAVLALTNRGNKPVMFRLHGHHFRLLDRLDDGWKPFWLDTLAINAGQTQRIAFLADYPGLYPIEVTATNPASPRQFRSYLVE